MEKAREGKKATKKGGRKERDKQELSDQDL